MTWSNRQRAGCPVLRSLRIAGGQRRFGGGRVLRGFGGTLLGRHDALRLGFEAPYLHRHHGFRHARRKRPQVGKRLIPMAVGKGPASGGDRVSGLPRRLRLARGLRH